VVDNVECLGAELNAGALGEVEVLDRSDVPFAEARFGSPITVAREDVAPMRATSDRTVTVFGAPL
jgi:hypothetical protein